MGTEMRADTVRVFANSQTWLEGTALQQLQHTAQLPGMVRVAGMPDLHPGRGYPVGAAFFSVGRIYPALVGNDIGCGMRCGRPTCRSPSTARRGSNGAAPARR